MIDRSHAEDLLYRAAIASIGWHPHKATEEPGYTIDDDIDWCLEPVQHIPHQHLTGLRGRVRELIEDPTTHRYAFRRDLLALVT